MPIEVLAGYQVLSTTASDAALGEFLKQVQANAPQVCTHLAWSLKGVLQLESHCMQLKSAVKSFTSPQRDHPQGTQCPAENWSQRDCLAMHAGTRALSGFGESFFKTLLELEEECSRKRSRAPKDK